MNLPVTSGFPQQSASNMKNVSMQLCDNDRVCPMTYPPVAPITNMV